MDAGLKRDLEEKVRGGERLSRDDGTALYASDDLAWLGGLAHEVRTRFGGDAACFTVGRDLDLSAVGGAGGPDADTGRVEAAVRRAGELAAAGATELRIHTGPGLAWSWECYPRLLRALKEALPQVSLTAFTATQIHRFETAFAMPASAVLDELADAGVESLAVGDDAEAEVFDPEVRRVLADPGIGWEDFSRIHRLAHERGVRTPCAMRYGHVEGPRHRVDHLLALRGLQDETGGFQVFVPVRHRFGATGADDAGAQDGGAGGPLGRRTGPATGAEALRTFAVCRLLLDNVPHVRVRWPEHGLNTAQLALQHGADDIDGPVVEPSLPDGADGSAAPDTLTVDDLLDLIRDAGLRPVRRDARHAAVRTYEGADPGRRDVPQPMRV